MAFNGSGTFVLVSGNPVVTGTTISSTWANNTLSDVATGLSNCVTRDGQSPATANLPMGGFKLTGLATATALGDALSYGRAATVSTLTDSALTSGRVTYASTAGLLADSANLTFDGTTLTAAGLALSGGTANGVAYLNASKVLTTGSALTFDGTNFGIGTSSVTSGSKLTIAGGNLNLTQSDSRFIGGDTVGRSIFSNSDITTYAIAYGSSHATNANQYVIVANGNVLTYNSSGNLGLGVTPSAWGGVSGATFEIKGNAYMASTTHVFASVANGYFNGSNWIYKSSNYATRYEQASGAHTWSTAPSGTAGNAISFTQAMTLDASSNLSVLNDIYTGSASNSRGLYSGSGSANLLFGINGTEKMRLDTSGNLLVGQTTQSQTGQGFSVIGTGGGVNQGTVACGLASSTSAQVTYVAYSTTAAAYRFYVDLGGTVHATSTSIAAISDQTLKTNIKDLETGLSEVLALKPRRFDWINGDATNVAGFIAQEVEEVLPELVIDSLYSTDEDGNEIHKKNLKMGDILPTLVKAIQELKAELDELKQKVN